MAAPVFRAVGAASSAVGTAACVVAAPAGIATGDLEVMGAATIDGQTVSITTAAGGAWTAHPNNGQTVAAGSRVYVWYRIRGGADGDPQVTATGDHVNATRICYQTGTFDPSDPLEAEAAGANATSDSSFSATPGNNTSAADRLCCCFGSGRRDNNTGNFGTGNNTSLTSFIRRSNHGTSQGLGSSNGFFEGVKAAAGTTGTFTSALTTATPDTWLAYAINPAPPVSVQADRRIVYSILQTLQVDRRLVYAINVIPTADRRIVYGIGTMPSADRRIVYTIKNIVTRDVRIVYTIAPQPPPPGAGRMLLTHAG